MLKFSVISDTHTYHDKLIIEPTDVLLHAGDFTGRGSVQDTKAFLEWFSKQPATYKICISGNHDYMDYDTPALFKELLKEYPEVKYLKHEMVQINGIKIWGRPTTPAFNSWAFMADRGSPLMLSTLSVIPSDIDILLTHGPCKNILDRTISGEHVGCEDMLNELDRIKPGFLVCGHIHESAGSKIVNKTMHINASVLNERYKITNKPVQFSIDKQ